MIIGCTHRVQRAYREATYVANFLNLKQPSRVLVLNKTSAFKIYDHPTGALEADARAGSRSVEYIVATIVPNNVRSPTGGLLLFVLGALRPEQRSQ